MADASGLVTSSTVAELHFDPNGRLVRAPRTTVLICKSREHPRIDQSLQIGPVAFCDPVPGLDVRIGFPVRRGSLSLTIDPASIVVSFSS